MELGRAQVHAGAAGARDTLRTAARCLCRVAARTCSPVPRSTSGRSRFLRAWSTRSWWGCSRRRSRPSTPSDSALRVRLLARLGVALYWSPDAERRLCGHGGGGRDRAPAGRPRHARIRARESPGRDVVPDRTEENVQIVLTSCTASATRAASSSSSFRRGFARSGICSSWTTSRGRTSRSRPWSAWPPTHRTRAPRRTCHSSARAGWPSRARSPRRSG